MSPACCPGSSFHKKSSTVGIVAREAVCVSEYASDCLSHNVQEPKGMSWTIRSRLIRLVTKQSPRRAKPYALTFTRNEKEAAPSVTSETASSCNRAARLMAVGTAFYRYSFRGSGAKSNSDL